MNYPGGKNGAGVYQQIISLMPKHLFYAEVFLGGGAILRKKKPAETNVGVEIDRNVFRELAGSLNGFYHSLRSAALVDILYEQPDATAKIFYDDTGAESLFLYCCDALDYLQRGIYDDALDYDVNDVLVYCDPPYPAAARSKRSKIYDHEMMSDEAHDALLDVLLALPFRVMISSYDNDLYNKKLSAWRKEQFPGISRGGGRTETVYLNFPEPDELHDYRFIGENHRQREDFKRMKKRWMEKLQKMPRHKRLALLSAIEESKTAAAANGENAAARENL